MDAFGWLITLLLYANPISIIFWRPDILFLGSSAIVYPMYERDASRLSS